MKRLVLVAAVIGSAVALPGGGAGAEPRNSLFPERSSLFPNSGCSSLSRINPCGTRRLPAPVGDPTDGPLTDELRKQPLDFKPDPLGLDAELPTMPGAIVPQTLPSQKRN